MVDLAKLTAANLIRWNAASVTHERLREVLRYEAETGHFFWLRRLSIRIQVGAMAGSVRPDGYISFVKDIGRWHARIMSEGQLHLLGYFDSPKDAHAAYAKKAAELHGEFARLA